MDAHMDFGSAGDSDLRTRSGIPIKATKFFHSCVVPSSESFPSLKIQDRDGLDMVTFQPREGDPPFTVPCVYPEHTHAICIGFALDHFISGDHSHDDGYWNERKKCEGAIAFIIDAAEGRVRHIASIAVIFEDTIKASQHNRSNSILLSLTDELMTKDIPYLMDELAKVDLNGKSLDEAIESAGTTRINAGFMKKPATAKIVEREK